uniref:Uncharacterized protein n=1 Tax=viral metagenome TaxID=1070528 RepID=A0A6M3K8K4_9ZZZZ
MPTVYVVNKGSHDHSDAERYGEIRYLTKGKVSRYATNNMWREFFPTLKDSKPEDYILVTGLTVMNIVATSIFSSLHGKINLLLYKGPTRDEPGRYVERTFLPLGQGGER